MTNALLKLWPDVEYRLGAIVSELRVARPALWAQSAVSSNAVFPFSATLSFISGDPTQDHEDVVFSLGVKAEGARFRFSSDLAAGDGRILAEGPASDIDSSVSESGLLDWASECIEKALDFAQGSMRVIEIALR
jgi:hypothetical protein